MQINLEKKQIRTFGLGLSVVLLVSSILNFYKGHQPVASILLILGIISATAAIFFPTILKPVYIVFMKIAHVLGWVNTRILLGVLFYLIITPMGIIIKIVGKDLLDRKIETERQSYWHKKEKITIDKSRYEKQY